MTSELFTDLYRYRQREQKNNLEDWLTECLAAILRALNEEQWADFLGQFLGPQGVELGKRIAEDGADVRTQFHAGAAYGIPDLAIFLGDKPIILFENKVAHSVAEGENEAGERQHQLHRYAKWLNDNRHPDCNPHLIFITHITRPPEDFTGTAVLHDAYRGISRRSSTWGLLARLLLSVTSDEGDRSLSHSLAAAFYSMLKDQNMANEFPTSTDIASLEVFLSQGAAVVNLLDRMWNEIAFVANASNMAKRTIEPEFDYGRYTAWRYVNRVEHLSSNSPFLMTGIWFPEVVANWTPADLDGLNPRGPQVFLLFAFDDDDMFEGVTGKPTEEWRRPSSDFIRLAPLYEFAGPPDERASRILEWLGDEAKALRTFLLKEGVVK
jgi:hypothetical protein